jgi:hypothetical protein
MERSFVENEPLEVTLKVTGAFEKMAVPYLVGGSLASTLYGMVRTTQDADIIAEMLSEHVGPFVSMLGDEFYVDEESIAAAVRHHSSFNIIHRESMFKVDVFIPRPRPFLRSQLTHARKQTFSFGKEVSAMFASAEDTILSKLEWYRMGGESSDRQWRDVLGILKTQTDGIDLDYLHRWAHELKVADLLERALDDSAD